MYYYLEHNKQLKHNRHFNLNYQTNAKTNLNTENINKPYSLIPGQLHENVTDGMVKLQRALKVPWKQIRHEENLGLG